MIKAVFFDWGGVLIDDPKWPIIRYAAQHLAVDENTLEQSFKRYLPPFQTGAVSEGSFWQMICTELGIALPTSPSLWYDAFACGYREQEETFRTIGRLKEAGYKIGFLSNTEHPARSFFHEKRYACFDAEIFSCAEGVAKPERDIYLSAAAKLCVMPEECIFVDDKKENIQGACATGMAGILFRNHGAFARELWDKL